MPNEAAQVSLVIKDKNLAQELSALIQDEQNFEIIKQDSSQRPNLMIIELGHDYKSDLNYIQSYLNQNKTDEIFLTSNNLSSELLLHSMRIGAKEFFPLPLKADDVKAGLYRFSKRQQQLHNKEPEKLGCIISVVGSKGGVGTTTIAANLSVALAHKSRNQSVALVDMNTIYGEIPMFLDISPKFHWGDITKNIDRLDDTFLLNILVKHSSGVYILPSPNYLNQRHAASPQIIETLLNLMKSMFDCIVIDNGQSTDETALKILQMSDRVILVSIQSLPCLANTTRLVKSFVDYGYVENEKIQVLLNRYIKKNELSLKNIESGLGRKVSWTIPNDFKISMTAMNKGKMLQDIAPRSAIAKSIGNLSQDLLPETGKKEKQSWFFKRK